MAMTTPAVTITHATASDTTRAAQLIFGIICMVMIANLKYGWTLFVNPIDQQYHWGRAAVQFAFTIFVLTETWLVPIEGYLIDRFGPRLMISASGVLVAIAWVINSMADSLFLLYVGAAIGGVGAGVIYGGSVGNALKWFPDRRGLAAGLTAAGFGAGSALTVVPIANMIQSSGYQRSEEHTSELQSHRDLHSFPTRRSSDLDRRGLAAGLTAAGFGAGSALTVVPIANMIQSSGYQ